MASLKVKIEDNTRSFNTRHKDLKRSIRNKMDQLEEAHWTLESRLVKFDDILKLQKINADTCKTC